jgi:hypothetical protein
MKAKHNPTGMVAPADVELVRIGVGGKAVHVYNPSRIIKRGETVINGGPLCASGFKGQHVPEMYVYRGENRIITCMRCMKILTMNKSGKKNNG